MKDIPDPVSLPPHITFEQGKGLLQSILRGDPERGAVIRQSWRQLADTWFPGNRG